MCVLLCLSNCFPLKWTLCLCMKDDSPASTRSSSPKLDWMIKRGMVGLCLKTCPGFTSTPSVSWFCHEVAIYFWCGLDGFCFFGFGGSGVEIEHSGLHASMCGEDIFGVCGYALDRARLVWYTTFLQLSFFNALLAHIWLFFVCMCVCVVW